MSLNLSNLSSYGSQVLGSGDLVARDTSSSLQYRLNTKSSTHSSYVTGEVGSQEATRLEHAFDEGTNSGRYKKSCLRSDGEYAPTIATAVESSPEETTISTDDTSATLSQGLSFDSDEASIYFGVSKTFRIRFLSDDPKRLVFQYLEPSTSEYVTKLSFAKT